MECSQHAVAAVKDLLGSIGTPEVSSAGDEVGVPKSLGIVEHQR